MILESEIAVLMRSVAKAVKPQLADLRRSADTSVDLIADLDLRLSEIERRLTALEKTS